MSLDVNNHKKIMKKIIYLFLIVFLGSCDVNNSSFSKEIYFDSTFPNKNFKLTKVLGDEISLNTDWSDSTVTLKIVSDKLSNLIVDNNGDTLFYGKVFKYSGLYYFNQHITDDRFWIHAVKIDNKYIYGLGSALLQMYTLRNEIITGLHKNMLLSINSDSTVIELRFDKNELRKIYAPIVNKMVPDTMVILENPRPSIEDEEKTIRPIDSEKVSLMYNVFPNPTNGIVNIELQDKKKVNYVISDMKGKSIFTGSFSNKSNTIDLTNQTNGEYILTLTNASGKQKKHVKIIKSQ